MIYEGEHANMFALIAGSMVHVSPDEFPPAARGYGLPHPVICSLMAGMAVMAISRCCLNHHIRTRTSAPAHRAVIGGRVGRAVSESFHGSARARDQ